MGENLITGESDRLLENSLDSTYVALFTTVPNEKGEGGVEVSGGAYERQPLTITSPANEECKNDGALDYAKASAEWGEIKGYGVFTAKTAGTLRWRESLEEADYRTVKTGDEYRIGNEELTFTLS
ncbi:MAG TPA: hypothetical protein VGF95_14410 [Solirubrobacteraceae bacterium]|jgi:hypothetical protein